VGRHRYRFSFAETNSRPAGSRKPGRRRAAPSDDAGFARVASYSVKPCIPDSKATLALSRLRVHRVGHAPGMT